MNMIFNDELKGIKGSDKSVKKRFSEIQKNIKDKINLKQILLNVHAELDLPQNYRKSFGDIYEEYLNNEDFTKRDIPDNKSIICLWIMFYLISPLFSIFNLFAIFQSIYIMGTLTEVIGNSVSYYIKYFRNEKQNPFSIENFNDTYNIYYILLNKTLNDSLDFNLMMFLAFLGDILLKSKGFTFSIVIFCVLINGFSFYLLYSFNFRDYDIEYNSYSIFQILYLIGCYLLLFVGVGSSSLLSQQIIAESNFKFQKYIFDVRLDQEKYKRLDALDIKMKLKEENRKIKELKIKEEEKKRGYIPREMSLRTNSDYSDYFNEEEEEEDDEEINEDNIHNEKEIALNKNDNNIRNKNLEDKEKKNENKSTISYNANSQNKELINDKNFGKIELNNQITESKQFNNLPSEENMKSGQNKKKKKESRFRKVNKSKFNSFFQICLTTILAYFAKYFFNLYLNDIMIKDKQEILEKYSFNNSINIEEFMENSNSSTIDPVLYESIIKDLYHKSRSLYIFLIASYALSLFISWIFYKIFVCNLKKREKENQIENNGENNKKDKVDDSYRFCEVCGYTLYWENKKIEKKDLNGNVIPIQKYKCLKLFAETCINCYNEAICSGLLSCLFCHRDNEGDEFNCCCCCCINYNEKDYEKDQQFFCYCYQKRRKCYWINDFLTKDIKKIVPYLIEYFILRLTIIGFEKQYEINAIDLKIKDNYIFIFIGVFIGTFLLFLYLTLSFNKIIKLINIHQYDNQSNIVYHINLLSNEILSGINGILFFTSILSLVLSSFYQSNLENETKLFIFNENNYIILIPLLMTKFYHFTLIYFCLSYSEDNNKFDLIKGSTLIKLYLSAWDFIIWLIKLWVDQDSINSLYIIQLVCSSLVLLYFLIWLFLLMIKKIKNCQKCLEEILKLCYCLFSFLFCCGGCWYNSEAYDDVKCGCKCTCEGDDCESLEWTLEFKCCYCVDGNFHRWNGCCEEFNFCNPIDYLVYLICCCFCCGFCTFCECFNFKDNCVCKGCNCYCNFCEKCCCCQCCKSGYCCYCCDFCEILDCCACCNCIYCCGDKCGFDCYCCGKRLKCLCDPDSF